MICLVLLSGQLPRFQKSSEEQAEAKIYKTETRMYHGFHIEGSKEMAKKLTELRLAGELRFDSQPPQHSHNLMGTLKAINALRPINGLSSEGEC
ncbi:hypothetical protein AgCh_033656 [Apium graveolens]